MQGQGELRRMDRNDLRFLLWKMVEHGVFVDDVLTGGVRRVGEYELTDADLEFIQAQPEMELRMEYWRVAARHVEDIATFFAMDEWEQIAYCLRLKDQQPLIQLQLYLAWWEKPPRRLG